MDKKLYQTLVEQFAIYDQEDLKEILSDNESSEEAIAAAKYILSGESIETKNFQSEIRKHETLIKFMFCCHFGLRFFHLRLEEILVIFTD